MPQNIEEQIKAYLLEKLAELRAVAPGDISLTVRATQFKNRDATVVWDGHCSETGWEASTSNVDELIASIAAKSKALPDEAERLCNHAARLLDKAAELEARKPNPRFKTALEFIHTLTKEAV